jgi:lipoic acid synthetase
VPRAPEWIRERKLRLSELHGVKSLMREHGLHTVCEEARCPNRGECFSRGTATFLLLGDVCTRACGFCDIRNGKPAPPDPLEPWRVRGAVERLGLSFVVLTSVDRDDLPDAAPRTSRRRSVRSGRSGGPGVEVLTPDFRGRVGRSRPSSPRSPTSSTTTSRPSLGSIRRCEEARLDRSLFLLSRAKEIAPAITTKSGLMLGLGEREEEVHELSSAAGLGRHRDGRPISAAVARDLRSRVRRPGGVRAPSRVRELFLGFRHVFAGPFVGSSYRAEEALHATRSGEALHATRSGRSAPRTAEGLSSAA